eukprot:TRINITY_DN4552_c0_g2_i2.p1 TRINITY_DN4552_c0_g2~~TRINITY_DN4552_c0_g2_i2.p1  ORF type:complete len:792 (+),score=134.02 TRINITY_DN4552_c0_g2_i2:72-2378(+)
MAAVNKKPEGARLAPRSQGADVSALGLPVAMQALPVVGRATSQARQRALSMSLGDVLAALGTPPDKVELSPMQDDPAALSTFGLPGSMAAVNKKPEGARLAPRSQGADVSALGLPVAMQALPVVGRATSQARQRALSMSLGDVLAALGTPPDKVELSPVRCDSANTSSLGLPAGMALSMTLHDAVTVLSHPERAKKLAPQPAQDMEASAFGLPGAMPDGGKASPVRQRALSMSLGDVLSALAAPDKSKLSPVRGDPADVSSLGLPGGMAASGASSRARALSMSLGEVLAAMSVERTVSNGPLNGSPDPASLPTRRGRTSPLEGVEVEVEVPLSDLEVSKLELPASLRPHTNPEAANVRAASASASPKQRRATLPPRSPAGRTPTKAASPMTESLPNPSFGTFAESVVHDPSPGGSPPSEVAPLASDTLGARHVVSVMLPSPGDDVYAKEAVRRAVAGKRAPPADVPGDGVGLAALRSHIMGGAASGGHVAAAPAQMSVKRRVPMRQGLGRAQLQHPDRPPKGLFLDTSAAPAAGNQLSPAASSPASADRSSKAASTRKLFDTQGSSLAVSDPGNTFTLPHGRQCEEPLVPELIKSSLSIRTGDLPSTTDSASDAPREAAPTLHRVRSVSMGGSSAASGVSSASSRMVRTMSLGRRNSDRKHPPPLKPKTPPPAPASLPFPDCTASRTSEGSTARVESPSPENGSLFNLGRAGSGSVAIIGRSFHPSKSAESFDASAATLSSHSPVVLLARQTTAVSFPCTDASPVANV